MARPILALLLAAAALVACSSEEPRPLATLAGFPSTTVTIDDRELAVAVADNGEARGQGLMNVYDLGRLDGMLFVFEADTETGFWMHNTPIPLDIAFFSEDGTFVDRLTMETCLGTCPTYYASGPYRYALEAPAGDLESVGPESVLRIDS